MRCLCEKVCLRKLDFLIQKCIPCSLRLTVSQTRSKLVCRTLTLIFAAKALLGDSYTSLTYASLSGVFDMLLVACAISFLFLLLEWVVASFCDVDRSDPTRPSEFSRALAHRWRRLTEDAKENWLPFKRFRRHVARYRYTCEIAP